MSVITTTPKSINLCNLSNKAATSITFNPTTVTIHSLTSDFIKNNKIVHIDEIKDIKILVPNKVVQVLFTDGRSEKVVCHEEDEFNLERAVQVAVAKHHLGSNFNRIVSKGLKQYDKKLKTAIKEAEKAKKDKEEADRIAAKKKAKREAYIARRREQQIDIQKEAYLRALREFSSKKADS